MHASARGGRRLLLPNTHPAWHIRWPLWGLAGFMFGMAVTAIGAQYNIFVPEPVPPYPAAPQVLAAQDEAGSTIPLIAQNPVITTQPSPGVFILNATRARTFTETVFPLINFILVGVTFIVFLGMTLRRVLKLVRKQQSSPKAVPDLSAPQGYVVHYKTGKRIEGASVVVYDRNKRVLVNERTGPEGTFSTLYPEGEYYIGVDAPGFDIAGSMALAFRPKQGIVYSGGKIIVPAGSDPLAITIPLKPTIEPELSESFIARWRLTVGKYSNNIFWILFLIAMTFNLVLLFFAFRSSYIAIQVLYVLLGAAFALTTPSALKTHGLVRDAVEHTPVDLAVVRLFTDKSHKLVQTQVSNSKGQFRLNPSQGTYTLSVTKSGFAPYARDNVDVNTTKRKKKIVVDLMPIKPRQ